MKLNSIQALILALSSNGVAADSVFRTKFIPMVSVKKVDALFKEATVKPITPITLQLAIALVSEAVSERIRLGGTLTSATICVSKVGEGKAINSSDLTAIRCLRSRKIVSAFQKKNNSISLVLESDVLDEINGALVWYPCPKSCLKLKMMSPNSVNLVYNLFRKAFEACKDGNLRYGFSWKTDTIRKFTNADGQRDSYKNGNAAINGVMTLIDMDIVEPESREGTSLAPSSVGKIRVAFCNLKEALIEELNVLPSNEKALELPFAHEASVESESTQEPTVDTAESQPAREEISADDVNYLDGLARKLIVAQSESAGIAYGRVLEAKKAVESYLSEVSHD